MNRYIDTINGTYESTTSNERFKVIALIGSTKFKDTFIKIQKEFTLKGFITLAPCIFTHSDPQDGEVSTEAVGRMLDEMGKQRIDMCDFVYVVNVDGYLGEHTKMEILYAASIGKPIYYLCTDIVYIQGDTIPSAFHVNGYYFMIKDNKCVVSKDMKTWDYEIPDLYTLMKEGIKK